MLRKKHLKFLAKGLQALSPEEQKIIRKVLTLSGYLAIAVDREDFEKVNKIAESIMEFTKVKHRNR